MTVAELQNWLVLANLVVTTVITLYIQNKSAKDSRKTYLDNKLFHLQGMSFEYSFLENEKYICQWNKLKSKYDKGKLSDDETKNFLRYDAYVEMLLNYVVEAFNYYKTEKKLLNYVDFKSWVRPHANCWKNPLSEHSNRDTYGDEFCDMIDRWIK